MNAGKVVKVPVTLKAQDKSQNSEFSVRELDSSERTRNALKWLGIFWGLSLASIPIALAHFVLVPGFFIAGIFMAWRKYSEVNQIQAVSFPCVFCESEIQNPTCPEYWPLEITCASCRNILTVEKH